MTAKETRASRIPANDSIGPQARRFIARNPILSVYLISITVWILILSASIQFGDGAALSSIGKQRSSRDRGCYYMLQHYKNGEQIRTDEPCLNCTCENSMLMCYLRVCPYVKPVGDRCIIERVPGECCPRIICPNVAPPSENNYEQEFEPETPLPTTTTAATTTPTTNSTLNDNLNDMTFANSSVPNSGCTLGDKIYREGSQMPSDPKKPCEVCYCIRNSSACVMQECALEVSGCSPIYAAGGCCPTRYNCSAENAFTTPRPGFGASSKRRFWELYPGIFDAFTTEGITNLNSASSTTTTTTASTPTTASPIAFPEFGRTPNVAGPGCKASNSTRIFADGERVPSRNKCEHCYCMRSEIVCAVQECRPPCDGCVPIIDSNDQCCPKRYECIAPTKRVSNDNVIDVLDSEMSSNVTQPTTIGDDVSTKQASIQPVTSDSVSSPASTDPESRPSEGTSAAPISTIETAEMSDTDARVSNAPKQEVSVMTTRQTKPPIRPISPKLSTSEDGIANDSPSGPEANSALPKAVSKAGNVDGFNLNGEREQESNLVKSSNDIFEGPVNQSDSMETVSSSLTSTVAPSSVSDESSPTTIMSAGHMEPIETTTEARNLTSGDRKSRPLVVPSAIPGEGTCRYNGRIYQNGEEIKYKRNCTELCMCINSVVYCDEVDCPKGPSDPDKCQKVMIDGECCPKYICPDDSTTTTALPDGGDSTTVSSSTLSNVIMNDQSSPTPTSPPNVVETTAIPATNLEQGQAASSGSSTNSPSNDGVNNIPNEVMSTVVPSSTTTISPASDLTSLKPLNYDTTSTPVLDTGVTSASEANSPASELSVASQTSSPSDSGFVASSTSTPIAASTELDMAKVSTPSPEERQSSSSTSASELVETTTTSSGTSAATDATANEASSSTYAPVVKSEQANTITPAVESNQNSIPVEGSAPNSATGSETSSPPSTSDIDQKLAPAVVQQVSTPIADPQDQKVAPISPSSDSAAAPPQYTTETAVTVTSSAESSTTTSAPSMISRSDAAPEQSSSPGEKVQEASTSATSVTTEAPAVTTTPGLAENDIADSRERVQANQESAQPTYVPAMDVANIFTTESKSTPPSLDSSSSTTTTTTSAPGEQQSSTTVEPALPSSTTSVPQISNDSTSPPAAPPMSDLGNQVNVDDRADSTPASPSPAPTSREPEASNQTSSAPESPSTSATVQDAATTTSPNVALSNASIESVASAVPSSIETGPDMKQDEATTTTAASTPADSSPSFLNSSTESGARETTESPSVNPVISDSATGNSNVESLGREEYPITTVIENATPASETIIQSDPVSTPTAPKSSPVVDSNLIQDIKLPSNQTAAPEIATTSADTGLGSSDANQVLKMEAAIAPSKSETSVVPLSTTAAAPVNMATDPTGSAPATVAAERTSDATLGDLTQENKVSYSPVEGTMQTDSATSPQASSSDPMPTTTTAVSSDVSTPAPLSTEAIRPSDLPQKANDTKEMYSADANATTNLPSLAVTTSPTDQLVTRVATPTTAADMTTAASLTESTSTTTAAERTSDTTLGDITTTNLNAANRSASSPVDATMQTDSAKAPQASSSDPVPTTTTAVSSDISTPAPLGTETAASSGMPQKAVDTKTMDGADTNASTSLPPIDVTPADSSVGSSDANQVSRIETATPPTGENNVPTSETSSSTIAADATKSEAIDAKQMNANASASSTPIDVTIAPADKIVASVTTPTTTVGPIAAATNPTESILATTATELASDPTLSKTTQAYLSAENEGSSSPASSPTSVNISKMDQVPQTMNQLNPTVTSSLEGGSLMPNNLTMSQDESTTMSPSSSTPLNEKADSTTVIPSAYEPSDVTRISIVAAAPEANSPASELSVASQTSSPSDSGFVASSTSAPIAASTELDMAKVSTPSPEERQSSSSTSASELVETTTTSSGTSAATDATASEGSSSTYAPVVKLEQANTITPAVESNQNSIPVEGSAPNSATGSETSSPPSTSDIDQKLAPAVVQQVSTPIADPQDQKVAPISPSSDSAAAPPQYTTETAVTVTSSAESSTTTSAPSMISRSDAAPEQSSSPGEKVQEASTSATSVTTEAPAVTTTPGLAENDIADSRERVQANQESAQPTYVPAMDVANIFTTESKSTPPSLDSSSSTTTATTSAPGEQQSSTTVEPALPSSTTSVPQISNDSTSPPAAPPMSDLGNQVNVNDRADSTPASPSPAPTSREPEASNQTSSAPESPSTSATVQDAATTTSPNVALSNAPIESVASVVSDKIEGAPTMRQDETTAATIGVSTPADSSSYSPSNLSTESEAHEPSESTSANPVIMSSSIRPNVQNLEREEYPNTVGIQNMTPATEIITLSEPVTTPPVPGSSLILDSSPTQDTKVPSGNRPNAPETTTTPADTRLGSSDPNQVSRMETVLSMGETNAPTTEANRADITTEPTATTAAAERTSDTTLSDLTTTNLNAENKATSGPADATMQTDSAKAPQASSSDPVPTTTTAISSDVSTPASLGTETASPSDLPQKSMDGADTNAPASPPLESMTTSSSAADTITATSPTESPSTTTAAERTPDTTLGDLTATNPNSESKAASSPADATMQTDSSTTPPTSSSDPISTTTSVTNVDVSTPVPLGTEAIRLSDLPQKAPDATNGIDATASTSSPPVAATTSPADQFITSVTTSVPFDFRPINITTVIPSIRGSSASITIPWADISNSTIPSQTTTIQPSESLNFTRSYPYETSTSNYANSSTTSESDYEEITEDSGCEYEGKSYNSAQQIPRSHPCDFCFCFRGDIICLQQTCPPPVPHCFETVIDGFCCPRYECPVHTVRASPNSTNLSLTPYETHSRLHAHAYDIEQPHYNNRSTSNVRGCFVDNKLYGVGQVISSASGPCLECKCDTSGMMRCNPKECTPEDPLLQQINREVLQSTLSRSQAR